MTLSETNKIDNIVESEKGEISLVIITPWEKDGKEAPGMVQDLNKKLCTYISYIENGQYAQKYGNSPVMIEIFTFYKLSPEANQLLEKVQKASAIDIKITEMDTPDPMKEFMTAISGNRSSNSEG